MFDCSLAVWSRPGVAGLAITSVITVDLATDQVGRTFLQQLVQLGGNVPQDVADFVLNKAALPVAIKMACAQFTSLKVHLRNATIPERDLLRDAYFFAAIGRLLAEMIVQDQRSVETHLALLNAVNRLNEFIMLAKQNRQPNACRCQKQLSEVKNVSSNQRLR